MSARKAVVVGGGPVGALTAIVLAEQGWRVQVLQPSIYVARSRPVRSFFATSVAQSALSISLQFDVKQNMIRAIPRENSEQGNCSAGFRASKSSLRASNSTRSARLQTEPDVARAARSKAC